MLKSFRHNKPFDQLDLGGNEFLVEPMEPRVLLSADALGIDAGVLDRDTLDQPSWDRTTLADWSVVAAAGGFDNTPEQSNTGTVPGPLDPAVFAPLTANTTDASDRLDALGLAPLSADAEGFDARREIVFLDAGVADGETLLDDLAGRDDTDITQVFILDPSMDGIEQITQALAGQQDIDAVHIISHGSPGSLQLGNSVLNTAHLTDYSDALGAWGQSLATDADILIYGCDLAAEAQGRALVDAIGTLTGADVAASTDLTGDVEQGGDWDLEYNIGSVEAGIAFNQEAQRDYSGTLAIATFQEGISGYSDTQDTYVDSSNATSLFGTSDDLTATNGTDDRQVLVRFDNIFVSQGGLIPDGATINSATLTLDVSSINSSANISIHRILVDGNWDESSTWNSLGNGMQLDDLEAVSSAEDMVNGGDDPGVFDVTDSLTQWSQWGASNYGWVLDSDHGSDWKGTSSEKSTSSVRPLLTVDYTPADIASGLVVHLEFEDGSGTVAADSTPNNNDALLDPGAEQDWTTGAIGGAFHFDFSAGDEDFFEIPDTATVRNVQEGSFTLAAWFNPENIPTAPDDLAYGIIAKEGNHTGLWYNSNQQFAFEHTLSGPSWPNFSTMNTFAPGSFYHVAVTVDRPAGTMELFVNGELEGTKSFTPGAASYEYGSETWKVGTVRDTFGGSIDFPAKGTIDDVRIYDRALSGADISELFTLGNNDPTATNLTSTSTYTEGAASVAIDDIVVTDADTGETITATLTLNDPTTGSLTTGTFGTANSTYTVGTGVWTVTGTVTDVNAALADVAFVPTTNNDIDTTITTHIEDAAGAGPADGVITLDVTPQNDAPSINTFAGYGVNEDDNYRALTGISIDDIDAGGADVQVSLGVNDGVLLIGNTVGLTSISGNDTGSVVLVGSITDLNAALASLSYKPDPDYAGSDNLSITVDDLGNTGSGGSQVTIKNVPVTVNAINDEQVLSTNTGTTVAEGSTGTAITATMLETTDVDNSAVQQVYIVTAVPGNGTLRLSGMALGLSGTFTQDDIDNNLITYDHDGSETTTDSFAFSVDDGAGVASTGTFAIIITGVNDNDPVADDESFTVIEGGTATEADLDAGTSLLDGDTDADLPNDTLTVNTTPVSGPSHGTLTLNANGTFSYTHDGSENFSDSFTYELLDADGGVTDTGTVTIAITTVNDNDPVADDESFTVIEGGTATEADLDAGTNLLDGDTDADLPNDTLTVNTTPVSGPSHGTLTLNADGTFSYTHDGSENFTDGFTYELLDADSGVTDTGTVTINITPQNDNDPIADDESFTVVEGGTATEADLDAGTSLLDGDTDADLPNDTLRVNTTPVAGPSHGTLTLNADGTFSYTHDGSENFSDSFTYELLDADGGVTDTGTVTIAITTVNDNDPVADDESFTVIEGGTATEADLDAGTSLLDGDTDADLPNDTLTVNTTPVSGPSHGSLTLNASGTFSYTHDGSENFSDSFTYELLDADGGVTDTGTVTINITPQNDNDPVADDESFTVIEGGTATEADLDAGTSLLDGDTDADLPNDTLTVNTTPVSGPSHGTLTLNANGTFGYTHDGSENFSDSFTYELLDADGGVTDTGTVTITITPVNDNDPIADDESFTVVEGGTATEADLDAGASLLDGDTDADLPNDTLTVNTTPVSGPSHGSLTLNANGTFSYTHDGSENFSDSFTYELLDGDGGVTDTGTVVITITPQNDAPTLVNPIPSQVATENLPFTFQFVAGTFSDVDTGDSLSYSAQQIDGTPLPGWLNLDAVTRTFSGTPSNSDVTTTIEVTARDSSGATVFATFDLVVVNVNDAPILGNNNLTLNHGDTVVLTPGMLSAGDVDDANAGLLFTVSSVSGGQFELVSASGIAVTSFNQAQVAAGNVVFVDDGDAVAPSYSVTVSDGTDSLGPIAATVNFTPPSPVVTIVPLTPSVPGGDVVTILPATPTSPSVSEPEPDPAEAEEPPDTSETDEPVLEDDAVTEDESVAPADDSGDVGAYAVEPSVTDSDFNTQDSTVQGLLKSFVVRPPVLASMGVPSLVPAAFQLDALASEIRSVLASGDFNDSLDRVRDDISNATLIYQSFVGSGVAVTTGLSVGYVAWLVRGGVLLSTALSSLPAWQFVDPLPVLSRTQDKKLPDDPESVGDDSLEAIIKEQSSKVANQTANYGDKPDSGTVLEPFDKRS